MLKEKAKVATTYSFVLNKPFSIVAEEGGTYSTDPDGEITKADLWGYIKDLQEEKKQLEKQIKEQKQLEEAERIADEKARKLVEQEEAELEAQKAIIENLVEQKLKKYRADRKIEFPVNNSRKGNLDIASKQLLDIIMGRRPYGAKALTTGDTPEWIPVELNENLIDLVTTQSRVRNLFTVVNMPTNPYKFPILTGDITVYDGQEATPAAQESKPQSDGLTLTAKKFIADVPVSTEEGEDAIVPILPLLRRSIARAFWKAEEGAIIEGDTASGTGAKKNFDGLVKQAANTITIGSASAAPTLSELRKARALLGVYGISPTELAWIVGPETYYQLLNIEEFKTVDKYGSAATVLTGELGRIDNIPVVVSDTITAAQEVDLTEPADGVTDAYQQKGVLVYRPGVYIGDRRQLTIDPLRERGDVIRLECTSRSALGYAYVDGSDKYVAGVAITFQWPK
jgi:HK97 family phage major capsid protein